MRQKQTTLSCEAISKSHLLRKPPNPAPQKCQGPSAAGTGRPYLALLDEGWAVASLAFGLGGSRTPCKRRVTGLAHWPVTGRPGRSMPGRAPAPATATCCAAATPASARTLTRAAAGSRRAPDAPVWLAARLPGPPKPSWPSGHPCPPSPRLGATQAVLQLQHRAAVFTSCMWPRVPVWTVGNTVTAVTAPRSGRPLKQGCWLIIMSLSERNHPT